MSLSTRLAAPDKRVVNLSTRNTAGFTLLEILVVMVIIGVVVSMVSLSINILGRDTQVEDQSKRLEAVIAQVREESEMQGKDVGLFVERDGYLFMRYNYMAQTWIEISDDELLGYRALPAGLETHLWLDGREVILKTHAENTELTRRASDSESSSSSSQSSAGSSSSEAPPKDARVPQIAILSSGDLTPFELRIEREGTDYSWHIVGKPDSTLTVEATDAQH